MVIKETDADYLLEEEAIKIHKQLNEAGEDVSLDTVRRGLVKQREKDEAEKNIAYIDITFDTSQLSMD